MKSLSDIQNEKREKEIKRLMKLNGYDVPEEDEEKLPEPVRQKTETRRSAADKHPWLSDHSKALGFGLLILALISFAAAVVIPVFLIAKKSAADGYIPVQAVIDNKDPYNQNNSSNIYRIKCHYTVSNVIYTASLDGVRNVSDEDSRLTVFYDPSDPGICYISKDIHMQGYEVALMSAMIIASLVMLIIAIWVFRAGSKAKKAEDAAFTASFGYNDFKNTESGSFEFYKSPGNIESENTNK